MIGNDIPGEDIKLSGGADYLFRGIPEKLGRIMVIYIFLYKSHFLNHKNIKQMVSNIQVPVPSGDRLVYIIKC